MATAKNKPTGLKYDQGKPPLALLDSNWLIGVSQVLAFGAEKYAAHNWREGIDTDRLVSASMRHILAFNAGEDRDPETGLSHLLHASCCMMFAYGLSASYFDFDALDKRVKTGILIPEFKAPIKASANVKKGK